jgi:hypothetical protein
MFGEKTTGLFYCKTHDSVLCKACLPSLHRACTDVVPLDDAARNAKTSTALADLENSICDVLKNVKSLIQDREVASQTIVAQEKMIKNKIEESRAKINKCLDTMEEKLIHELDFSWRACACAFEHDPVFVAFIFLFKPMSVFSVDSKYVSILSFFALYPLDFIANSCINFSSMVSKHLIIFARLSSILFFIIFSCVTMVCDATSLS